MSRLAVAGAARGAPAHRRAAERGQTLVEFALVIPLVFLIFSAIFDLGRAVYAYDTIANAARQGARVAAVNQLAPPDTNAQCAKDMPIEDVSNPHWSTRACAADAAIGLGVAPSAVTVSYAAPSGTTLSCSPLHVGCLATVTVAYTWSANTPVIGRIVGPLTLTATSQIPIERVFP